MNTAVWIISLNLLIFSFWLSRLSKRIRMLEEEIIKQGIRLNLKIYPEIGPFDPGPFIKESEK